MSEEVFHEKVGVSVPTQALASGAVQVKEAGGVPSNCALHVDVDWVVAPVPSRATTYHVCQPSDRASLARSVYEEVAMAAFFSAPST